jgi:hypothetical protein
LNKALIPILGITLVDVLGFTMLIPILPYYAEHYGASPVAVGLIYSTVHAVGAVPVLASIAALAIGWRVFVRPPLADEAI